MTDWRALRAAVCLKDGVINLNAGTCSPTSKAVLAASQQYGRELAEDPVEFGFRFAPLAIERSRDVLAAYLGCDPRRLLFVTNASYGVSMIARSLEAGLVADDEIVTTDQEYHHYHPLWRGLAQRRGAKICIAKLPTDEAGLANATPATVLEAFAKHISPRTKIVFFSHVTSVSGTVLPAAQICALARANGALSVVDGAHAPGLVPVKAEAIGADFYVANVHKWLMGAAGSGFVFVREEARSLLEPLVAMGPSIFDWQAADERTAPGGPTRWCWSHEYQGTRNLIPFIVVPEVVRFRESLPEAELQTRIRRLARYARERIGSLGYEPLTPAHAELSTGMVAFRLPPALATKDLVHAWESMRSEHAIELAFPKMDDGTGLLRVSCAWFNEEAEVDHLVTVLAGSFP